MPTEEQVERLRERLATPCPQAPGRLTDAEKEQIVADFLAGMTQAEIARKFGVRHQTVAYHLRKHLR